MKKMILIFLAINSNMMAQTETYTVEKTRGFVFMPEYHPSYDRCCPGEASLGYNDYFFPLLVPSTEILGDSNIEISFKNCYRIEINNFRKQMKERSNRYIVTDTSWNTHWYALGTIFITPVEITYKIIEDKFPKMMSQDSFELQVYGGAKIYFYPQRKAILLLNLRFLSCEETRNCIKDYMKRKEEEDIR